MVVLAGAAGGSQTPTEMILVVDPFDAESLYAANAYRAARGVPLGNVVAMEPGAASFPAFASWNVPALRSTIAGRRLDNVADNIVLMPGAPFFIEAPGLIATSCPAPVQRFSITGAYSLAIQTDRILSGVDADTRPNGFATTGTTGAAFDNTVTWSGGTPGGGNRYYLATLLGFTGERGNTIAEVIDMIDRSVAADFTQPAGTFFFCETNNAPRSDPREPLFPLAVSTLQALGFAAEVRLQNLPVPDQDGLGILTGLANPNIVGGNFGIVDGAFCDHLTSFAAAFDIPNQAKLSEWITKGASGSFGTIEEACNGAFKFPSALAHVHYADGSPLGVAVFRSLAANPYQGLLVGDPMTRPYMIPPTLDVVPAATTTTGEDVAIAVNAAGVRAGTTIVQGDLVVNGEVVQSVFGNPSGFTIETDSIGPDGLADGWHEVRVLVRDNHNSPGAASWTGELAVNRAGRSVAIEAGPPVATLGSTVTIEANAAGAQPPIETRLVHLGRVVATLPGSGGTFEVPARVLGSGLAAVQAEAVYADGMRVRSAPVELDLPTDPGTASGAEPEASGVTVFASPGATVLVPLPFAFDGDLADLGTLDVQTPAQAAIVPGPDGPFRLLEIDNDATGFDRLVFRITSPSGDSQEAVVTIVYDTHPLDRTGDERLTLDDLYVQYDSPIDLDGDSAIDDADNDLLESVLRSGERAP